MCGCATGRTGNKCCASQDPEITVRPFYRAGNTEEFRRFNGLDLPLGAGLFITLARGQPSLCQSGWSLDVRREEQGCRRGR